MLTLASDYLVPSPEFLALALLYAGLFVVWPLVQALRAGRYLWAAAILLVAPIGAILWWIFGRRSVTQQQSATV